MEYPYRYEHSESYIPNNVPEIKNVYTKLYEMMNEYSLMERGGREAYLNTVMTWMMRERNQLENGNDHIASKKEAEQSK